MKIIFDTDIFVEDNESDMTLKDIRLIIRYLDCILFSRHVLHSYLTNQADITDDDISHLITFQGTENITTQKENQIINESKVLRPLNLRPKPSEGNSMDLELFGGVNLKSAYGQADGPKQAIEVESQRWVSALEYVERVDPSNSNSGLTNESMKKIVSLIKANKEVQPHRRAFLTLSSILSHFKTISVTFCRLYMLKYFSL